MIRSRPFRQIDVFTSVPFMGNPVAVVLDGAGLSDANMQHFANWTNLSETTFVTSPTDPAADYAVRIFTPQSELPFAGHPTLGTAFAILTAGIAQPHGGKLVQQCAAGLVNLAVPDDWATAGLSLCLPHHRQRSASDVAPLLAAIGGDSRVTGEPAIVDVGPHWVIAQMVSAAAVIALVPDLAAIADYNTATQTTGLTVFSPTGHGDGGIVVRSFAPTDGLIEDPVCGSGNGAVAAYRLKDGAIGDGAQYIARQGAAMGRDGYVKVRIDGDDIHIGGACVGCIEGTVLL